MAEGLGVAAAIIGVATLAYQSSKSLYELISTIREAPATLQELGADLSALQQLLGSLEAKLKDTPDTSLSEGLKYCLEETKPCLEGCAKACKDFRTKLSEIMSHSTQGHTSRRDKVKLHFQEQDILVFRYRIASWKATLSIALELASL